MRVDSHDYFAGSIYLVLSATAATFVTPKLFAAQAARTHSRALVVSLLSLILLVGFGLRAYHLSAEGLSEDELNKLNAVADYRAHGLTSTNGEHPFLMKALLTLSVLASETWNESRIVAAHPQLRIAEETALRLPSAVFGTFTALLLFLLVAELLGPTTALITAALWALDPAAIGFNRIAKVDTFLLFFFLRRPRSLSAGTWHELRLFAGEPRIGHEGYEFLRRLYHNRLWLCLRGSPWYFYYSFLGLKPPLTLVARFLIGLPPLFTRRLG